MDIRVIREHFTPACTIGRLLIDGRFECFTLEDCIRGAKVAGNTAIPVGRYAVTVTHSQRFKRRLPLLGNVPKFSGIRIHPGNSAADTAGCILVGRTRNDTAERIGASRVAFDTLLPKIESALQAGEVVELTIEQVNAPVELAAQAVRRRPKRASATKRIAVVGKTTKKRPPAARTTRKRR